MVDADVAVIGAGVAGSTVATLLAASGARVVVFEKDVFPRDKLCGEFLSYEVRENLRAIGVADELKTQGAQPIRHARLTSGSGVSFDTRLPGVALGISRYRFDNTLAERAADAGATLRFREPVKEVSGSLDRGFEVKTDTRIVRCRAVAGSYGRQCALDRKLNRDPVTSRKKMAAFKAHFRGGDLEDVIELHSFPGGYCGVSPVENGLINVCWLTTSEQLRNAGGTPEAMMSTTFGSNQALADRMAQLEMVSSGFLSVAGLSFVARTTWASDIMFIGDAAGMISPLCGDGMGMAIATAMVAAPMLLDFLEGDLSASDLKSRYTTEWKTSFRTRMRLGASLSRLATDPRASAGLIGVLSRAPSVGRWLIHKTRS